MIGLMLSRRTLAAMVLANVILTVVYWFYFEELNYFPPEAGHLYNWQGHGMWASDLHLTISWVLFSLFLVASICILMLKVWAVIIFVALVVAQIVWHLASGIYIMSPTIAHLNAIFNTLDGAIALLAMHLISQGNAPTGTGSPTGGRTK